MEEIDYSILYEAYFSKLQQTDCKFIRYLYNQINWETRLIGIVGARGVGKTTLLLQRIKLMFGKDYQQAFYASLDNLWFNENTLIDLASYLNNHDIKYLFLDEVHKYPNWAQNLKNIYDMYPQMHVVYTGSSVLEIDNSKADLSRRQTLYTLRCMSFREYLEYEDIAKIAPISLEEILSMHVNRALEIKSQIKVLTYFSEYLKYGCYPHYKLSKKDYHLHLLETIRLTIDSDVSAIEPFEYQTLGKMKKMLMLMSHKIPYTPNIKDLCAQISVSRNLGIKLLYLLDKAAILRLLTDEEKSYQNQVKPEKVLFNNPNLMYIFSTQPDMGTLRESFFANQLDYTGNITLPTKGGLLLDKTFHFEVGGRNKNFDQIKDITNSYLAVDQTPVGWGNHIPLWLFGMMY